MAKYDCFKDKVHLVRPLLKYQWYIDAVPPPTSPHTQQIRIAQLPLFHAYSVILPAYAHPQHSMCFVLDSVQ